MLNTPSPSPSPPPLEPVFLDPDRTKTSSPLEQIIISKTPKNQFPFSYNTTPRKLATLGTSKLQKTKPIVWFAAILCFIFSLMLIFFGIATLICYLSFKPKNPIFDIPNASLNAVYFDSTQYLNGEFTLLTNFSNPNRRVHVRFESLVIELFYSDRLISTQSIKPFTQKPRERRLQSVKLISNLVFLPQDVGVKLQKQVQNNRLNYYARGTFKVRVNMGIIHFSFLLHSVCQMEMTSPPAGALVARKCNTFR